MEHLVSSYSRRDEKYGSAVAECLRSRGIEVWQDISGKASGIPYSTKWFEVIQEALFSSAGAVIFTSDQWEKSDPCKKEFELIRALDIPYKMVGVPDEERAPAEEAGCSAAEERLSAEEAGSPAAEECLSAEEAAELIAAWSAQEVYGNAANMDRVWMLSMIWNQRTKYGALAGIPYFRKRKDSKEFLERLERCRAISEEKGFPERLEKCRVIVTDDYIRYLRQVRLRPQQKVVQLWHAAGAFKRFGLDAPSRLTPQEERSTHDQYTDVIVSSEDVREFYAGAFGVPVEIVRALGVPRTDRLLSPSFREEAQTRVFALCPKLKGKTVYLYAPTFREIDGTVAAFDPALSFEALDAALES